jgi:hypothetical protein
MPALNDAKAAIESEMAHVAARISWLKLSLEQLDAVIDQADVRAPSEIASTGRQPGRVGKSQKPLPKTGEAFWLQFMGQEPKQANTVFSAALSALAMTPGSTNAKILRQRLSVILSTMIKKGVISAEGAGHAKRYKKA